jgi:putative hydrolase of the HAD superfamily
MADNRYDTVLCDLGNVLINFDHRVAVKKILGLTSKKEEDIYQLFFDSGLTKDYEEGKITSLDFFHRANDALGLKMGRDEFFPIWDDIFFETPLNLRMQDFLRSIKAGYKLVMISNINESHFGFLKKKMPIFNEFDNLVLSYEVGFRKPAHEIYNAALKSVNTAASKAFYIDDRMDLIEAASKFGIKGIAFEGTAAFKKITQALS